MLRRLVQVLTALAAVTVPALAVVAPPAQARPSYNVSVPTTFSPNGDGVQDTLRVRYTVPRPTHGRLEIIRHFGYNRVLRAVDLGLQPAGTYRWTWDGRNSRGRLLDDGMYWVRLTVKGSQVAMDRVKIDTSFEPTLQTPTYGATGDVAARVFPRTTVVTDAVELNAYANESKVASLRLVIRNAAGRVVRDADVNETLRLDSGYTYGIGRTVLWAARRADKPLPKGRYSAVVTGRDKAGNPGTSERLRIWVSDDELVWRETTTTVLASELRFGSCTYSSANGCGDFPDCGQVVPSALYAGGLSYRSKPCAVPASPLSRASSYHLLQVPEATGVRGVSAVRVAFAGAATTAGEPDVGTLSVWGLRAGSAVVGTSGRSEWVLDPSWGEGDEGDPDRGIPQRDPGAAWSFATTGTDSVDVASYTVDVRYLAVAD